nr:uncharacterized protein LOC125971932 isoform X4 [Syngnathus scovelli]
MAGQRDDFANLVRAIFSLYKCQWNAWKLRERGITTNPTQQLSRLQDQLERGVTPSRPTPVTTKLLTGIARTWGVSATKILQEHYVREEQSLRGMISSLRPEDKSRTWQVAQRWVLRRYRAINPEVAMSTVEVLESLGMSGPLPLLPEKRRERRRKKHPQKKTPDLTGSKVGSHSLTPQCEIKKMTKEKSLIRTRKEEFTHPFGVLGDVHCTEEIEQPHDTYLNQQVEREYTPTQEESRTTPEEPETNLVLKCIEGIRRRYQGPDHSSPESPNLRLDSTQLERLMSAASRPRVIPTEPQAIFTRHEHGGNKMENWFLFPQRKWLILLFFLTTPIWTDCQK